AERAAKIPDRPLQPQFGEIKGPDPAAGAEADDERDVGPREAGQLAPGDNSAVGADDGRQKWRERHFLARAGLFDLLPRVAQPGVVLVAELDRFRQRERRTNLS